ncbi:MAG: tRNA 2-thiouridine(34) synthase MnmA [Deltaproteobacteria bacterium]|nr:tRNA 2-thiouridine(34) synthase MnmA [Deltaproteobacteria bacterium]
MTKNIALAFSGGIDSLTTGKLLIDSGNTVTAVHARLADVETDEKVEKGADLLGVPLVILDFRREFESTVIESFRREISVGRTPNPCVYCNRKIKFGLLYEKIRELGFNYMATGHYARITYDGYIQRGVDRKKDQSYFLWRIKPEVRKSIIFPMGEHTRNYALETASLLGFEHNRTGSQDICFSPGSFDELLKRESLLTERGIIRDMQNNFLGYHRGLEFYTAGQRKGIGIASERALYVIRKDTETNTLYVGDETEGEIRSMDLTHCVWSRNEVLKGDFYIQTRYKAPPVKGTVLPLYETTATVIFHEKLRGVPPGQAAVFYKDDLVVGGGWIQTVHLSSEIRNTPEILS